MVVEPASVRPAIAPRLLAASHRHPPSLHSTLAGVLQLARCRHVKIDLDLQGSGQAAASASAGASAAAT